MTLLSALFFKFMEYNIECMKLLGLSVFDTLMFYV